MTPEELTKKAYEALGETYPSLGTNDQAQVAKAQAFALLAIAEELAALREAIQWAGMR